MTLENSGKNLSPTWSAVLGPEFITRGMPIGDSYDDGRKQNKALGGRVEINGWLGPENIQKASESSPLCRRREPPHYNECSSDCVTESQFQMVHHGPRGPAPSAPCPSLQPHLSFSRLHSPHPRHVDFHFHQHNSVSLFCCICQFEVTS